MTRPTMRDLFQPIAKPATPAPAPIAPFDFAASDGWDATPLPTPTPDWLKWPGEDGYIEFDRFMGRVGR